MAKKEKEELFEKETKYCKIIRSVELKDGDELFALEKIYIKALDRYEIRICLYRAMTHLQSLAQEFLYATGVVIK